MGESQKRQHLCCPPHPQGAEKVSKFQIWIYLDDRNHGAPPGGVLGYLSAARPSQMVIVLIDQVRREMSRSRSWNCMIPNWTQEDIDSLDALSCAYIVYGKELAPSTGMPHLQCFIMFDLQKTQSAVTKLIRGHLTAVTERPWDAADYCKKDGDFTERGSPPKNPGKRERADWDGYLDAIKRGRSDELPAKLQITLSSHIARLETKYRRTPSTLDGPLNNVWIWGAPGAGKSRKAREDYPGIYAKSHNKWWGGYNDEAVVLIDDIDPDWKGVGEHLRQWADRYPFPAEIKGGDLFIRPKTLVVTCNYCLQAFCDRANFSPVYTAALARRFTEIYLVEKAE